MDKSFIEEAKNLHPRKDPESSRIIWHDLMKSYSMNRMLINLAVKDESFLSGEKSGKTIRNIGKINLLGLILINNYRIVDKLARDDYDLDIDSHLFNEIYKPVREDWDIYLSGDVQKEFRTEQVIKSDRRILSAILKNALYVLIKLKEDNESAQTAFISNIQEDYLVILMRIKASDKLRVVRLDKGEFTAETFLFESIEMLCELLSIPLEVTYTENELTFKFKLMGESNE